MSRILVPSRKLWVPPRWQHGYVVLDAYRGGAAPASYRSRLQFGGADGSTTFTDDTGKTWTVGGNAQIDTSLGDQRALFDGGGDYITTPHHSDLVFSADFKIAFGLRYNSKSGYQTIMGKGYTPQAASSWLLQTGNGDGLLNFYYLSAGSGGVNLVASETGVTVNNGQDYAIEIARVGTAITIKRDGVTRGAGTSSFAYVSNSALVIGGGSNTGFNNYWFNGWIKDFSIT